MVKIWILLLLRNASQQLLWSIIAKIWNLNLIKPLDAISSLKDAEDIGRC